ncbi:uncharacterized protein LOC111430420 isoform X2 [Cucurbita moschata]|uniref:Uncharacterized protein LOC111430420 isoform X2 n=1 Tax=Cucurbita moschata TaxID=3662 RepID=A0A6J1E6J2_CUCMO|nr:uncharacterized protein LOC111430420 isoform X2 [Cucurbita moschata]
MQRIEYLWDSSFRFARITQKRINTLPNSEVGMICCVVDAIMELLFCCSNKSGVCSTAPLPSLFCLWKVCIETGPSLCVGRQSCWSKVLSVLPAIFVLNLPFAASVMSFLILHVSPVAVNTTRIKVSRSCSSKAYCPWLHVKPLVLYHFVVFLHRIHDV